MAQAAITAQNKAHAAAMKNNRALMLFIKTPLSGFYIPPK
jgi:hypothetical protein